MLGLGKKKKKEPVKEDDKNQETAEDIKSSVPVGDIRTMPSKFITHHRSGGGKKDNWLIYIIILIVVAVLIVAAIFLFNRIIESNDNTSNSNSNTSQINNTVNNNNENANVNINTNAAIEELVDVMITQQDLGEAYADYEESETKKEKYSVSNIDTDRISKYFVRQVPEADNISINIIVDEAANNSDALALYQIDKDNRQKLVDGGSGEFRNHSTIGSESYQFVNKDISVIEMGVYWKYTHSKIVINIYQGVLTNWDKIEDWARMLLKNIQQYNEDRLPVDKNTNTNRNANANANSNSNSNANVNINLNVQPPVLSSDEDEDGLTDVEELLYGTEHDKPDTDGDSYLDGSELIAGYCPLQSGGALLEACGIVNVYNSQLYSYRLLYPSSWVVQNTTFDGTGVTFTSSTSEFIGILIAENEKRLSPEEWYIEQSPGVENYDLDTIIVNGMFGVKSPDGMTVYLGQADVIYVISYNIGNRSKASFVSTFNMMVNSFKSTAESSGTNTNTNDNSNSNSNSNSNTNTNINSSANQNINSNSSGTAPVNPNQNNDFYFE